MTPVELPPLRHMIDSEVQLIRSAPSTSGSSHWPSGTPRLVFVHFAAPAPTWARRIFDDLGELATYGPDWDTYGAAAIDRASVEQAGRFISQQALRGIAAPAVVPMTDGGIQLEWHTGGVDLEISFSAEDPGVYARDLTGQEEHELPLGEAGALLRRYRERLTG